MSAGEGSGSRAAKHALVPGTVCRGVFCMWRNRLPGSRKSSGETLCVEFDAAAPGAEQQGSQTHQPAQIFPIHSHRIHSISQTVRLAIPNSELMLIPVTPKAALWLRDFQALVLCFFCLGPGWAAGQAPGGASAAQAGFAAVAKRAFLEAQQRYQNEPENHEVKWQFARACFDLATFATNRNQRAEIAEKGIGVCQLLAREPDSAPAHYYLGMNLGQLARTRTLGAFKLVSQMEREFGRARELRESLDYAGRTGTSGCSTCKPRRSAASATAPRRGSTWRGRSSWLRRIPKIV